MYNFSDAKGVDRGAREGEIPSDDNVCQNIL